MRNLIERGAVFLTTYGALVATAWGFLEATTYFDQGRLRAILGPYGLFIFYGVWLVPAYLAARLKSVPAKERGRPLGLLAAEADNRTRPAQASQPARELFQCVRVVRANKIREVLAARSHVPKNQRPDHPRRRVALVYADIDGFQRINDRFTTDIGDRVLWDVGGMIQLTASGFETFRVGDEFLVVYSRTDGADIAPDKSAAALLTDALALAETCRRQIEAYPWCSIAPDLYVTCSFAVAPVGHDEDAVQWMLRAIQGVKLAKKHGGNRVQEAPLLVPKDYSRNIEDHLS